MKKVAIAIVVLLIVLHQDFWNWHTHEPLVFGFIPIGLAWHVGISLAAGALSWFMVTYCWPKDVDVLDESGPVEPSNRAGH